MSTTKKILLAEDDRFLRRACEAALSRGESVASGPRGQGCRDPGKVSMSPSAHRILLVEDDRFLRNAAGVMLSKLGHTVIAAEDGEEALRLARAELPELILLDLIMPKIQGFEVLRTLKADPTTCNIPVIVMSNLSQATDKETTLNAGAIEYFVKVNLSLAELAAAVDRAMGEKPG